MADTREATVYLQLQPGPPGPGRQYDVGNKARVAQASSRPPMKPQPGCIVIKLRIRVPAAAWHPITPEAVIDVPAELIQHPISVEAVDADG